MKQVQNQAPTFESVWALLQENAQQMKESRIDFDKRMKESRADFDKRMKESAQEMKESRADFDRRIKKLEKLTGSWANSHGSFAEEYFYNSFEKGKRNFFGETFDSIDNRLKVNAKGIKDEYDIVLYNHSSVALIEVKYKAHGNDIPEVLEKAEAFRSFFPCYKHSKIYLGLASLSFYPELEEACIEQGIAVIKQVGDTVVIHDEHLKIF
jgi:hypothetical protein